MTVGDYKAGWGRPETAVLGGDQSFLLEFIQHVPSFGEKVVLIPVLKILEVNPLFRPEAKKECLQSELLYHVYSVGCCLYPPMPLPF